MGLESTLTAHDSVRDGPPGTHSKPPGDTFQLWNEAVRQHREVLGQNGPMARIVVVHGVGKQVSGPGLSGSSSTAICSAVPAPAPEPWITQPMTLMPSRWSCWWRCGRKRPGTSPRYLAANPVATSLITLGSPLGIRNLIFDRLEPIPADGMGRWPGSVTSWTNVADSGDAVALVKQLATRFGGVDDVLVHDGAKAHDCRPYLTAEETGRAVGLGL